MDNLYKLNLPFIHRWKGKRCPCLLPLKDGEKVNISDMCPCDNFTLNGKCRCKAFIKENE